jgi:hypothetical protein
MDIRPGDEEPNMPMPLKAIGFIFAFFLLVHWLTGGAEEIQEGPQEEPISVYQR